MLTMGTTQVRSLETSLLWLLETGCSRHAPEIRTGGSSPPSCLGLIRVKHPGGKEAFGWATRWKQDVPLPQNCGFSLPMEFVLWDEEAKGSGLTNRFQFPWRWLKWSCSCTLVAAISHVALAGTIAIWWRNHVLQSPRCWTQPVEMPKQPMSSLGHREPGLLRGVLQVHPKFLKPSIHSEPSPDKTQSPRNVWDRQGFRVVLRGSSTVPASFPLSAVSRVNLTGLPNPSIKHSASLWNSYIIFSLNIVSFFYNYMEQDDSPLSSSKQGKAHFSLSGFPVFSTDDNFNKRLVNWTDCFGAKTYSVWIAEKFHFPSPLPFQGEPTALASRIFRHDCQLLAEKGGRGDKTPETHTGSQLQKRHPGISATEHDRQGEHQFLTLSEAHGLRQREHGWS